MQDFYVDDLVYFSESDAVECKLEAGIQKNLKVDFTCRGHGSWGATINGKKLTGK